MNIERIEVQRTNITVVFDRLELSAISRDGLRELLPGEAPPIVTDVPDELISLVYPTLQIMGIFRNRRIAFDDTGQREIDRSLLPSLTLSAAHLIRGPRVVAFGFNYVITAVVKNVDDFGMFLVDRLLKGRNRIEARLEGTLRGLSLRLNYEREGVRYTLRVEPTDIGAAVLRSHFNAHFAQDKLPRLKELNRMFSSELERMAEALGNL